MQIEKGVQLFCLTVQIMKILLCREAMIKKLDQVWGEIRICTRNLLGFFLPFFYTLTKGNRNKAELCFRNSSAALQDNGLLMHLVLHWNSFHMILYKQDIIWLLVCPTITGRMGPDRKSAEYSYLVSSM